MLQASKNELEANLRVSTQDIRDQELQYYVNNCYAVATIASLLAGLANEGLFQVAVPPSTPWIFKLLYLSSALCSMCFELVVVMNTTLLALLAPGMALRGAGTTSVHVAVDGLAEEFNSAFNCFWLGIVFFFVSMAFYGWLMQFDAVLASALSVSCVGALVVLQRYGARVDRKLKVEEHAGATSGVFTFSSLRTMGSSLKAAVAPPRRWDGDGQHGRQR